MSQQPSELLNFVCVDSVSLQFDVEKLVKEVEYIFWWENDNIENK
jgi:hypothetical protein